MKKALLTLFIGIFIVGNAFAQDEEPSAGTLQGVITTGVPFLLIAADARSAGLADMGVATGFDAFSQQWNPAKYAFAIDKQGVGLTYTPYLSQLVNDIDLGNVVYYNRLNEQSAVGFSIRYFSTGEIELRDTPDQQPNIVNPNEFAIDLSYSLRLSERFAMAVAGRFINSDLKIPTGNGADAGAASTFAVDVAGYYQSEEIAYADFYGRWRLGFNISNIGPKLKYDDAGQENSIPTNLAIGGGFDFILDEYNKVGITAEIDKLLVPTPTDSNGDGVINREDDYYDQSFFSGIFTSFGDSDNELAEYAWSLGAEYTYQNVFALRTGYFNESNEAGGRKFVSLGAGFRYTSIGIDVSYLFSTANNGARSPLEGSLRFGLTFSFGDTYEEY